MNERIRTLAEQAGITTNLDTNYFEKDMNKWVDYFSEKFAELIVSECSRIADGWVDNDDDGKNYPSEMIKQHFGVEE